MKNLLILFWFLAPLQVFSQTALELPELAKPTNSVYHIDVWKDGGIILGSTAGILYGYSQLNTLVKRRCPCDPSEVNSFDRPAISNRNETSSGLANTLVTTAVLVPAVLDYAELGLSDSFKEDMVVYLEVLSVTQVLTTTVKIATARPYPQTYQPRLSEQVQDQDGSAFLSFFSGHTATTVAALSAASSTYMYRHGFSYWPWVITGTVGTLIGVELVAAGEHFPSDVLVGGAVGLALGTWIPSLHHRTDLEISAILPSRTSDQAGLRVTKYF